MAGGGFPRGKGLRLLFDSLIDPVVVLGAIRGPDGRIVDFEYLDANAAALEANRTTYDDLMGARLLTLFPAHGPSGLLERYAAVAETGEPVELNDQAYPHEFTPGRLQYYDVRATQVGDGISLTWRDRTELHESRLRLEDEQGRTRATLDGLMDPVILFHPVRDDAGRIVDFTFAEVNQAACDYNRTTREELTGDLLSVRYPDMWPLGMFQRFAAVVERGEVLSVDAWPYASSLVGQETLLDLRGHRVDQGIAVTWRDVTDRELMTQALADSEHRFRLLAEQASDIVFVVEPDHRVRWASPAITRVLGWRVDEFVGQDATSFIHPDDLATTAARIAAAHAGRERFAPGQDSGMIQRVRTSHGEYRWVRATATPLAEDPGEPGALAVGWHDVDSLVRANDELQRSQLSMDEAAIGLLRCDVSGTITYANDALARMMGLTPDRLVGSDLLLGALPEEQEALKSMLARVLEGSSEREHARRSLQHRAGSKVWVDSFVSPIRDALGRVDGLLVQVVDVTAEVANREALVRSAEHFRLLAENASDVVYETDMHGLITWVSPSVQRALGWEPDTLLGTRAVDLVHPGDRDWVEAARSEVYAGERKSALVTRFLRVDASVRHMAVTAHPMRDTEGQVSGAVVGLHDVTDEVRMRARLERSERTFRTAMVGAPQGMAMTNVQDIITDANPAFESLVADDKPHILGRRLVDFFAPDDPPGAPCVERLVASGEGRLEDEHRLLRQGDDDEAWVSHSVSLIRDSDGSPLFLVHHLQDVTDRHRREEDLGYRASHDLLTGLLNRAGLMARLEDWLPARGHGGLAVLFCDLDGLKGINDQHGHAAGDAVLAAIAARLNGEVRRGDIVARLSGDEFVIVLDRIQSREDALDVAGKICSAATGPVPFEAVQVPGAVSIGVAMARAGDTADDLLARADEALYRAKQGGRGRVSD